MSLFLSYVFLGLSLAAPIGPVNAAQMEKGLRGGFWHAWLLGLGSLLADIIFLLVVYFGTVHFLEAPFLKSFLWLFGCFVLTYSGVEAVREARQLPVYRNASNESLKKSFFTGFLLSISNPLSIMFWLGIYGSVLAETAKNYSTKEIMAFTIAIITGIMAWDFGMAIMASSFRRLLTGRLIQMISIVSGLSLIGFGLYFGWQAYLVFAE